MNDQPDDDLPDNVDEDDDDAMLQELLGGQKLAREHHYLFAHRVLPERLWRDTSWFLKTLYSEQALGFLLTRWGEAAEYVDDAEFLPPEGKLQCEFFELAGGCRAAVITLPEAKFVTEAYMVAIVSRAEQRRLLFFKTPPVLRYFTLEYSLGDDRQTPQTMLCEWKRGAHFNYGTGPVASPASFVSAIESLLSK